MRSNFGATGAVFDAVSVGVAVVDGGTAEIRAVNDAFCELLGRDRGDLLGRSLRDLAADGWTPGEPIDRHLDRALSGADPTVAWQFRTGGDAPPRRVEASLSRVERDEQPLVAMTVLEADSDPGGGDDRVGDGPGEDHRDPPPTPLSEAELRAVYHSVEDAIYVHDEDGEVVDANRRAAEMYGYPRERLREGAVAETSAGEPPYTPATARDRLRRASRGDEQTFEWKGKDRDGNEFWEEVTLTRTFVDGEVRVLAILRDIDERKRYERELEYRKAILEAQAEATIDGFLVVDEDRNIVSYNSRFLDMWDIPEDAATDGNSREVIEYALDVVADPEAYRETVEYLYENPGEESRDEIRLADGRWIDRYSGPVVGDDGTGYGRLWVFRDITERKERERELREQYDRLQALFANSRAAIVEYVFEDGEPVVEDVNERFEEVFGYDAGAVIGRSVDEFIVPPDGVEEADRLNEKVENGEYLSTEVQRRTADGVRSFLLRNAPIDTEDETRGYASYTDITERKQRERQLEEQREKYSTLVEQSHEGVAIVQDREYRFVNAAMADLTGRSEADLVGRRFTDVIAPEYHDLVERRYEKRIRGEDPPSRYDIEVVTADGDRRHVDLEVSGIQYEGEPATLATFNDITDRKQREQELAELNTRLQLALDETDTGVWEWTIETDEVFLDDGSKRLFGYDGEFPGTYESLSDRIHPEDVEDLERGVQAAIESGELFQADFRVDLPGGDQRWLQSRGIVEYDEDGDPERMFGVQTDITDRKQFERSLEAKNRKLELLNRIVRHDIRNDMTVARGRAAALEEHLGEGSAREHLDAIVESADHVVELTEIVRDLMATMLEEGASTDPVALAPAIEEELDAVRSMDDPVLDPPEGIPPVAVEADEMLGTVFRNLLTNAVRHNDTDEPHVSVSVEEREDDVEVRVADDGPGVPDSMKDDIFGRGEKGLESPGTGVGLYLVDTLVEGYGGEVFVEDNDPRGAVFVVRLPTTELPDDEAWVP